MVSERTLGIITLACIAAVVLTAGIRAGVLHLNDDKAQIVISNNVPDYPEQDTSFYEADDSVVPKNSSSPSTSVKAPIKKSGIPGVTARTYIVGDVDTGKIYSEYESKRVMPVASMSKLVTAFVATDLLTKDTSIEISSTSMMAPPDRSNLQVGEHYTLSEIMSPLLLSSSNVAAEAISLSVDNREKFLENMSSYAWEIGMPDTFFADPSGVSPKNSATGRDLFALARYLFSYRPDILALTRIASTSVATTTDHGAHDFISTHPFVEDPSFVGGKTGRTPEAGETMMTILNLRGKLIAIIVLGSQDRENDTRLLIKSVETLIENQTH